jgi:ATP-dependent Lon protease
VTGKHIVWTDEALTDIIRGYTREAGVRNLEREIAAICRKVTREFAEGRTKPARITAKQVINYLGAPRYLFEELKGRTDAPGIAVGLAWTPTGGDVLFVEASKMPGGKTLTITGQLGDVMKESAQAALSYIRAHTCELKIEDDFFKKSDIHMHIPAGSIPKDGPSAGVTMATALASLLTGRKVRSHVAMTGEITLRGKVLPVGGIKEKVLAAKRAGITTIILPKENRKDIEEDIPAHVQDELSFIYVDKIIEAVEHALEPNGRKAPHRKAR